MPRIATRIFLTLLLLFGLAGCAAQSQPVQTTADTEAVTVMATVPETTVPETTVPETEPPTQPKEERFLLTFVGDCTLGATASTYNAGRGFVKMVGEDYGYPFRQVIDYFSSDEATFLNLEGPLCDTERPQARKFVFRGPTVFGEILTQNSVEAVSVANNHTLDHGQQGYESTLAVLAERGIPCAKKDEGTLFTTKNGLTIGLFGAMYEKMDTQVITDGIRALAAQNPDVLIFAPHWGIEGSFRCNEDQIRLAHAAIDAGADIVWGTHPHVLQPIEAYNGGVIFYSLGNFSFGGNGDPKDYDTVIIQQEIIRSPSGEISLGEQILVPCSLSGHAHYNDYQPVPYAPDSREYARVLEKLDGSWPIGSIPVG